MSFKAFFSIPGYVLAWAVLPLLAIGGTMALFACAALTEAARILSGAALDCPDPSAARRMAARICLGYQAEPLKAYHRSTR